MKRPPEEDTPRTPRASRKYPLTDLEHAHVLVEAFAGQIFYVHAWKSWVSWDGMRWLKDDDEKIVRLAATISDKYHQLSLDTAAGPLKDAYRAVSIKLQSGKVMREMIVLARALVPRSPDDFDKDPIQFNTPSGTVNLKTGTLFPCDPIDGLSLISGISYNREAPCSEWMKFLFEITAGDLELIDFLQRAVGYSLTGYGSERVAFILHGSGRNGKSTFLEILREAIGEYAGTASPSMVMHGRDDKALNELAGLRGKRFVTATETEEGAKFSRAFLKHITGNEEVTARFLYGNYFSFTPQFKLWFATNPLPAVDSDDTAFWDRIRPIPFKVRFDKEDPTLKPRLRKELPGILNWAVEGALIWSRQGLGTAASVEVDRVEYRGNSDVVAQWIDDCCVINDSAQFRTGALFQSWRSWAIKNGVLPGRQTDFLTSMGRKGFERYKGGGNRSFIRGLALQQNDPHN